MARLLLLFLLILISVTPPSSAAEPTGLEIQIHRLVNDVRLNQDTHGVELTALRLYSVLIDVARAHSQDMLDRDYFAHIDPDGKDVADRVSDAGLDYTKVGENLFFVQGIPRDEVAQAAVDGWVNSPPHYANILTDFSFTGIGVASSGDTYYVTQVFLSADPAQLENKGQIYDNSHLDSITPDDNSFHFTAQMGAGIVIILAVLLGLDANRRNKKHYGWS